MPPSFLPAILAGVVAWATTGKFHFWYFLVAVIGVTVNHIALNITDDYFDYKHVVDVKGKHQNPYAGGSGVLTAGFVKPESMLKVFTIGYFITIALGLYLTAVRGWMVFLIGGFGMSCAYFYTAPPIRYGYRGFGELSQLINFSITIGLGSYFVQTQQLAWEPLFAVLPLGFMMFGMIIINEIPDVKEDRQAGKMNLVVRFGVKKAVWFYGISMAISYLIIVVVPFLNLTSYFVFIGLMTLPWFWQAFSILYQNKDDGQKIAPANELTIKIHNITGILLILAYILQGAHNQQDIQKIAGALIVLILLYLPVALTIFSGLSPSMRKK